MKPVRAKKKLGQHFLTDLTIARRIAETLDFQKYSNIIEIGPGMGVLTQFLVSETQSLNLVEIDSESVAYLKNTYHENQVNLIEGDFLKLDFKKTFGEEPFAIIGNFPYNISTQIVFKTLKTAHKFPFLQACFKKKLQNESVNLPGQKSMEFSLFLHNFFTRPNYFLQYLRTVFKPPPKVDSAVIPIDSKRILI
jgi:16S rRNA (adenine1518-N6/adenine1519-N6)-dimethyltransferase